MVQSAAKTASEGKFPMRTMNVDARNMRDAVIVRLSNERSEITEALRQAYPDAMWKQDDFARKGKAEWGQVKANAVPEGPVISEILVNGRFGREERRLPEAILAACGRIRERYPERPIVLDEAMTFGIGAQDMYELAQTDVIVGRQDEHGATKLPAPSETVARPHVSNLSSHILTFSPKGGTDPSHPDPTPFDPSRIKPVRNIDFVKPEGGGWLSVDGDWERWVSGEMPGRLSYGTCMVTLKDDARILEIRNADDLGGLPTVNSPEGNKPWLQLDFETLSEQYDGIYVNIHGGKGQQSMYYLFYGWDASSVILFDQDAVKEVSELRETPVTEHDRVTAKYEGLGIRDCYKGLDERGVLETYTQTFGNPLRNEALETLLRTTDPQAENRDAFTTQRWTRPYGKPTLHESLTVEPVTTLDDDAQDVRCVVTIATESDEEKDVRRYELDDEATAELHELLPQYTFKEHESSFLYMDDAMEIVDDVYRKSLERHACESEHVAPTIDPTVIGRLEDGLTPPEDAGNGERPAPRYDAPLHGDDDQRADAPDVK